MTPCSSTVMLRSVRPGTVLVLEGRAGVAAYPGHVAVADWNCSVVVQNPM